MTENPYASPNDASSAATAAGVDEAERTLQAIARRTFLAWEKLRLVYIAVLGLVTVLLVAPAGFLNGRLLVLVLEGAVVANVAYFAGPTIETYVRWLGYDRAWPRWVFTSTLSGLSV